MPFQYAELSVIKCRVNLQKYNKKHNSSIHRYIDVKYKMLNLLIFKLLSIKLVSNLDYNRLRSIVISHATAS